MTALAARRARMAGSTGRLVARTEGLVAEVREGDACSRYEYGAYGDLAAIADADGTRWEYAYGADGRLLSVHRDGDRHACFRYDASGRLLEVERRDGPRGYVYDEAGRLARTLRGDAGAFTYRYDEAGRIRAARSDHEESCFEYDGAGRVARVEQTVDGVPVDARFDFDAAGRLLAVRFPLWDLALAYVWDDAGRLEHLSWRGPAAEGKAVLANFGRDEPVVWRETADGIREETWREDGDAPCAHRVLRRGDEVLWRTTLRFDAALRLEREGDRAYAYDAAGRLVDAADTGSARRWRFVYDAANDLAAEEGAHPRPSAVEVDAAGRVLRVARGRSETVYRYNDAGELLDVRENGERIARFRYDHKGRLLLKATARGTERYLHGTDDGLLAVAGPDGAPRTIFLRSPEGLVGLVDFTRRPEGEVVFVHRDGRDNLVLACFADGEIEGPCSADPFGLPLERPSRAPYFCRDHLFHADVGLYRIGSRWYAPALRRFLTPDSYTGAPDDARLVNPFVPAATQRGARARMLGGWLQQPRMRNRHAYCLNDPVNRYDPDGHWSFGGVLFSLLGVIWTLPNTLLGLAFEITCLMGEVVRWVVSACSGGSVNWQSPGFDAAASGRLNAFALVFTGGWLGSIPGLYGITFGNVFFVNREWKLGPEFTSLVAPVLPPAYNGTVEVPIDDVLYEHELRHVNQYALFGPLFIPAYIVDWIVGGLDPAHMRFETDAAEHAGFP